MKFGELLVENNNDDFFVKLKAKDDDDPVESIPDILDIEFLKNIKIGDEVLICGMTSFATDSKEKVTNIKIKYDEDSGEPYNVIQIGKDWLFDSRTGNAITSPTMYYISR